MSALTPAQRQQAIGLYKRVIRTSRQTFAGDLATATAWRQMVRKEFIEGKTESDSENIEKSFAKWEDVIKVLQQNVVQGELNDKKSAFQLKFRPETELGSNESIKASRQKQMEDLRANKGKLACGGGGGNARSFSSLAAAASTTFSSSSSIASSSRAFSSSAILSAKDTEKSKHSSTVSSDRVPWAKDTIPRPVPHFGTLTVLSDGSTIQLHTTSPRGVTRLTRDPTNHPLWNPKADRRGAGDEDESGRLARFRRKFGGTEEQKSESVDVKAKSSASPTRGGFSEEDFEWMGVGGREAKGKAQQPVKKGAAGKGKGKK